MLKRLPLEIDGRAVHLEKMEIDGESGIKSAKGYWLMILQSIFLAGRWFSIVESRSLDTKKKEQLFAALRDHHHRGGYTAKMLALSVTEKEGICFCWCSGEPDKEEVQKNQRAAKDARNKRMRDKRMLKQWRK